MQEHSLRSWTRKDVSSKPKPDKATKLTQKTSESAATPPSRKDAETTANATKKDNDKTSRSSSLWWFSRKVPSVSPPVSKTISPSSPSDKPPNHHSTPCKESEAKAALKTPDSKTTGPSNKTLPNPLRRNGSLPSTPSTQMPPIRRVSSSTKVLDLKSAKKNSSNNNNTSASTERASTLVIKKSVSFLPTVEEVEGEQDDDINYAIVDNNLTTAAPLATSADPRQRGRFFGFNVKAAQSKVSNRSPFHASDDNEICGLALLMCEDETTTWENVSKIRAGDIWMACRINDEDYVLQTIQESPEMIHQLSHEGSTPLYLASQFGHANLVRMLLKAGAVDSDSSAYQVALNDSCKQLLKLRPALTSEELRRKLEEVKNKKGQQKNERFLSPLRRRRLHAAQQRKKTLRGARAISLFDTTHSPDAKQNQRPAKADAIARPTDHQNVPHVTKSQQVLNKPTMQKEASNLPAKAIHAHSGVLGPTASKVSELSPASPLRRGSSATKPSSQLQPQQKQDEQQRVRDINAAELLTKAHLAEEWEAMDTDTMWAEYSTPNAQGSSGNLDMNKVRAEMKRRGVKTQEFLSEEVTALWGLVTRMEGDLTKGYEDLMDDLADDMRDDEVTEATSKADYDSLESARPTKLLTAPSIKSKHGTLAMVKVQGSMDNLLNPSESQRTYDEEEEGPDYDDDASSGEYTYETVEEQVEKASFLKFIGIESSDVSNFARGLPTTFFSAASYDDASKVTSSTTRRSQGSTEQHHPLKWMHQSWLQSFSQDPSAVKTE